MARETQPRVGGPRSLPKPDGHSWRADPVEPPGLIGGLAIRELELIKVDGNLGICKIRGVDAGKCYTIFGKYFIIHTIAINRSGTYPIKSLFPFEIVDA